MKTLKHIWCNLFCLKRWKLVNRTSEFDSFRRYCDKHDILHFQSMIVYKPDPQTSEDEQK